MKKLGIVLAALAALVFLIAAVSACASESTGVEPAAVEANTQEPAAAGDEATTEEEAPAEDTTEEAAEPTTEEAPPEPELTTAQENAIEVGRERSQLSGFSRAGPHRPAHVRVRRGLQEEGRRVRGQLPQPELEEGRRESAESYLETGGFSLDGLIEQLESPYGDQSLTLRPSTAPRGRTTDERGHLQPLWPPVRPLVSALRLLRPVRLHQGAAPAARRS